MSQKADGISLARLPLYRLMTEELQARNADLTDDEADNLVEEAVSWVRTGQPG